ncbi:unnamed protein product [Trifolium pratense]|uniref:Uncharacterized protein n=1 Tax=Trifolium pratense TaxID=57577 RepID=A0ACB0J4K6_TRIPR|nr:unnamed protein product [Trifolium pratense]
MSQSEEPVAAMDRISQLSNDILCHILSFLPIKQAFTTTILSKRWLRVCYSLTVLSFNDETVADYETFRRFCRFIDTLMLSNQQESQLKTFSLKCRFWFNDDNRRSFDGWLEAAKQRRVEEFHIFLNNVTMSSNIFISQTLVVLKLENLRVEDENLCVDLPSLKTLHLKYVCFENQNDIKKVLKACPNLEDLHTSYPRYIRRCEKNKEFRSLFLSKLVKADIGSNDVPFKVIYNVKFLRVIKVKPSLKKNIKEFFKGIPVFGNLIHIELWFYGFFHGWDGVVQLLQHCPKLQILYMRKWNTSVSKDWECPISDLECLSSHLRSCTILNFEGSENDLRFAKYILQNARRLEVMTIGVNSSSSDGMQKHQIIEELSTCPRMSSGCKLSF